MRRSSVVVLFGAHSKTLPVRHEKLYQQLLLVAKKKTAEADVKLDDRGRPIDEEELDLGHNVLIVDPMERARQRAIRQEEADDDEE